MKNEMKYIFIKDCIIILILFIIQRVFNCFIYKTDFISTLYGIGLLTISFILHELIDELIMRYRLNRLIKKLEKDLQDWEDSYNE